MKGGASVNIADVRTLDDVSGRDTAPLAILIVMGDLGPAKTRNFGRLMVGHAARNVLGVRYILGCRC